MKRTNVKLTFGKFAGWFSCKILAWSPHHTGFISHTTTSRFLYISGDNMWSLIICFKQQKNIKKLMLKNALKSHHLPWHFTNCFYFALVIWCFASCVCYANDTLKTICQSCVTEACVIDDLHIYRATNETEWIRRTCFVLPFMVGPRDAWHESREATRRWVSIAVVR